MWARRNFCGGGWGASPKKSPPIKEKKVPPTWVACIAWVTLVALYCMGCLSYLSCIAWAAFATLDGLHCVDCSA